MVYADNKGAGNRDTGNASKYTPIANTFMFLLIIGIILYDYTTLGFNRGQGGSMIWALLLYIGYLLIYFVKILVFDTSGNVSEAVHLMPVPLVVTILQIFLPYLALEFIPEIMPNVTGIVFFLILMFSPWLFYYLFLTPGELQGRILNIVKIVWAILLVGLTFFMLTGVILESAQNVASTSTVNVKPGVAIDSFKGAIADQFKRIKQTLNETRQGYVYNQKGEIDKNRNARLGVFINDLRTIPSKILEDEQFSLLGSLEVNTIFNPILININCYLEKSSSSKVPKAGNMIQNNYHVFGKNLEILECIFPGADEGIYRAYFKSAFNFETWAYIDYTFVDKSLAMSYYREGRDINNELNIEKETIPIYTDGPAKIMMIAADQPTLVDLNRSNYPKIGLSLQKNFLSGKIQKVNEIVLQLPKMIWLGACSFRGIRENITEEVPEDFEGGNLEDYNYYRFRNNVSNPGSDSLRTIVCNMMINEDEYLRQKSANSKLVKTIVLKADYDYEVSSNKVSIVVKDNPYED